MCNSCFEKMSEEGHIEISPDGTKQDEDLTREKILELQAQSIGPMREDVAEWIAKILNIDIKADNFMDVLDNGVYICDLAKLIHERAVECVQKGQCSDNIPQTHLKFRRNAPSHSWFARDNSASFIQWCKSFGMQDGSLFESEDLVSHKSEKQVIITLLELARIGSKYGLEPPGIIQLEKELEEKEKEEEEEKVLPVPTVPKPNPEPPPSTKPLNLHEEVCKMAAKCHCSEHVKHIQEGTYMVFGKAIIIRLLKNRHLMVRVGGGWDTLEHYLLHHNPILTLEHRRKNSIDFLGGDDVLAGKYLYIKSKYKVPS